MIDTPSRLETSLKRLLLQCETMAEKQPNRDWRLHKYVGALQEWLISLKSAQERPPDDVLVGYTQRIDFLKGLLAAENLPTVDAKLQAVQNLRPTTSPAAPSTDLSSASPTLSTPKRPTLESPTLDASKPVPSNAETPSPAHIRGKQLKAVAAVRYEADMRRELLGEVSDEEDIVGEDAFDDGVAGSPGGGVRQRHLDTLLKHHQEQQDKMVSDMLSLVHRVKDIHTQAGARIRADNNMLTGTRDVVASNYDRLKVESDRLEVHASKWCNCGIWLVILAVCATFLCAIVLMRLFPKRAVVVPSYSAAHSSTPPSYTSS